MSVVAKQRLLIAILAAVAVAILLLPRIPQDPAYHQFADQRALLGIPNAFNVLSNLIFAWAGMEGLYRLLVQKSLRIQAGIIAAYAIFFAALALIAAGSAVYHWNPDNPSLTLDRLPIAIAFTSFSAILLAERVSLRFARLALLPLLLSGCASVVYWHYTEIAGSGDLRGYIAVVLLPSILLLFVLLACASKFDRNADLWWLLAWYTVARLGELFDGQIYDVLGGFSGHSLKHLAAGIGSLVFLRHLRYRQPRAK